MSTIPAGMALAQGAALVSPAGGGAAPSAPQDSPAAGIRPAPPTGPRPGRTFDDADRAMLRGVRRGSPLSAASLASALADGDPTGLESVTFGATNGRPAIRWTDERGQTQTMTLSSGQWLGALKARTKFRATAMARAEAMRERDKLKAEHAPVLESLMGRSRILGDPQVQAAMMAMFDRDPAGTMDRAIALSVAEKQDEQQAVQAARQLVIRQREEMAQAGVQALGQLVQRRSDEVMGLAQMAAGRQGAPAARAEEVATHRRDAMVMQTAAARATTMQARGQQTLMSSPMQVYGAEAADDLIEVVVRGGLSGRPLPYVPQGNAMHDVRLREIVSEVQRVSRMLGYSGDPNPMDAEVVATRLMLRAGLDVPRIPSIDGPGDPSLGQIELPRERDVHDQAGEAAVAAADAGQREAAREQRKEQAGDQQSALQQMAKSIESALTHMVDEFGTPREGVDPEEIVELRTRLKQVTLAMADAAMAGMGDGDAE